jgi:hypothetical protein
MYKFSKHFVIAFYVSGARLGTEESMISKVIAFSSWS